MYYTNNTHALIYHRVVLVRMNKTELWIHDMNQYSVWPSVIRVRSENLDFIRKFIMKR